MKTKESKLTKSTTKNLEEFFEKPDPGARARGRRTPGMNEGVVVYFALGAGYGSKDHDLGLVALDPDSDPWAKPIAVVGRPGQTNSEVTRDQEALVARQRELREACEAWIREHRPDVRVLTPEETRAWQRWLLRTEALRNALRSVRLALVDPSDPGDLVRAAENSLLEALRLHVGACPEEAGKKRWETRLAELEGK